MVLDQLIAIITTTGPLLGIIILLLVLVIVIIYRLDLIISLFKKSNNKQVKDTDILNGNIISINSNILLYLFDIHAKYRDNLFLIKNDLLDKQMTYYEVISDKIIDVCCKSYRSIQDQEINNNKETHIYSDPVKEFLLFKDTLRSVFYIDVIKQIEKSFKINGFYEMSNIELSDYVEKKVDSIMVNIRKQLFIYLPIFDDQFIVNPNDEQITNTILNKDLILEKFLDLYISAVKLYKDEYCTKQKELRNEFKTSINTLMLQEIIKN